ncbi:transposase [Thermoanaerobacterium saccharolyticum]
MILTAPSFKNIFSAITVISEIGVTMEAFPSAKHLCSWARLTPTNNKSTGKKKSCPGFQSRMLH